MLSLIIVALINIRITTFTTQTRLRAQKYTCPCARSTAVLMPLLMGCLPIYYEGATFAMDETSSYNTCDYSQPHASNTCEFR